jgi:hypothetical protein
VPRTLLAAAAWLVFAAGGARAATIIETTPFTIQAAAAVNLPAQTVNVSTPQFNPALGTFESGATTIAGTTGIALEFFNTGAGGPYDVFLVDTLTLAGIPGLFGEELTGIVPANQVAFISPPATFAFGPVDRSDPAGLVVGTGTWNQLFSLPFPLLTVKQGPAAVLPAIIISGSSVTTYTYTPAIAAVPEPRTTCILALLFGFGFVARNRRWYLNNSEKPGASNAG